MKTVEVSSLGFKLMTSVPDSIDEFDRLAGEVGAALRFAVDHEVAHGLLGEFRAKFTEELEKQSGVTRPTHTIKDAKGKEKVVMGTIDGKVRTDDEYFKLVLATKGTKVEDYQSMANTVMAGIVFDPKAKARGTTKIAERYITSAKAVLTAGFDKAQALFAKLSGSPTVFTQDEAGTADLTQALARAIKAYDESKDLTADLLKKVK